jgi:hypothetical protein
MMISYIPNGAIGTFPMGIDSCKIPPKIMCSKQALSIKKLGKLLSRCFSRPSNLYSPNYSGVKLL